MPVQSSKVRIVTVQKYRTAGIGHSIHSFFVDTVEINYEIITGLIMHGFIEGNTPFQAPLLHSTVSGLQQQDHE
jgi:hypothetical protein